MADTELFGFAISKKLATESIGVTIIMSNSLGSLDFGSL